MTQAFKCLQDIKGDSIKLRVQRVDSRLISFTGVDEFLLAPILLSCIFNLNGINVSGPASFCICSYP